MASKRYAYILLTDKKVHAFSSFERAAKVRQRAESMKVKFDYMSCQIKPGDPFKKTKLLSWDEESNLSFPWLQPEGDTI